MVGSIINHTAYHPVDTTSLHITLSIKVRMLDEKTHLSHDVSFASNVEQLSYFVKNTVKEIVSQQVQKSTLHYFHHES